MVSNNIWRGRVLRIAVGIIMLVLVLAILFSGCIEQDKQSPPVETSSNNVPAAPKQVYLHPDTTESFDFRGHEVSISYVLQNSSHNVEITIDGNKEVFVKNMTEQCHDCTYGKNVGDVTYVIRPVTWIINEAGEKVWSFDTWNTSELYFEMVIEDIRSR